MANKSINLELLYSFVPAVPTRFYDVKISTNESSVFAAGGFDGKLDSKSVLRSNAVCVEIAGNIQEQWAVEELKKEPITSVALNVDAGRVVVNSSGKNGKATIHDSASGQTTASIPDRGMKRIAAAGTRHFVGASSLHGKHVFTLFDAADASEKAEWLVEHGGESRTPEAVVCSSAGDFACCLLSVIVPEHAVSTQARVNFIMTGELVPMKLPEMLPLATYSLEARPINAVFIGDSKRIAIIGRQKERLFLHVVDLRTGSVVATATLSKQHATGIAYVEAYNMLGLLRADHSLEFRELEKLKVTQSTSPIIACASGANNLAVSPQGLIAVSSFGAYEGSGSFAVAKLPESL